MVSCEMKKNLIICLTIYHLNYHLTIYHLIWYPSHYLPSHYQYLPSYLIYHVIISVSQSTMSSHLINLIIPTMGVAIPSASWPQNITIPILMRWWKMMVSCEMVDCEREDDSLWDDQSTISQYFIYSYQHQMMKS